MSERGKRGESAVCAVDLDELERLCTAATPGPWEVNESVIETTNGCSVAFMPLETHPAVIREHGHWNKQDAAFIAAAREALPALIARVRELEAVREAQRHEEESARTAYAQGIKDERARWVEACQEMERARDELDDMDDYDGYGYGWASGLLNLRLSMTGGG